jgi:hypothetical protein
MVTCIASFLEPSFRGGHTEVLKTLRLKQGDGIVIITVKGRVYKGAEY